MTTLPYIRASGFAAAKEHDSCLIVAATGQFEDKIGKPVYESVPENILQLIRKTGAEKKSIFIDDQYLGYFLTKNGSENLIYLKGCHILTENDKNLISVYANNVAMAFDNIQLN